MKEYLLRTKWPILPRLIHYIGIITSAFSFCVIVYALFSGNSFIYPFEKELVPDFVKVKLFNYLTPFGDFSPEINSLITFQKYKVTGFFLPIRAGQFLQLPFIICLSVISALIIRAPRWPFYIGLSLLILFLVFFNLQEFGIIATYNDAFLFICIALVAVGIYALRNFFFDSSLTFHLICTFSIWIVIWLVIILFGQGKEILFQLSNFAIPASLIIAILYVYLIGHEPIHLFAIITSYDHKKEGKSKLINFIVLSVLYMLNVAMAYLKTIGRLNIDVVFAPYEFLLLVAILVGFYGTSRRFSSKKLFNAAEAVPLLYITLTAFVLSLMAFAHIGGHDAILEIIEDAVLYSQIGLGTLFFFYIILNFGDIIQKQVKVYKVIFKPSRFPLMTAFIGGTVIMVALLMRSSLFPYYQFQGNMYNGLADNYLVNGDERLAEVFYDEASVFALDNRRSNIALAHIYERRENRMENVLALKRALIKNPNSEVYVELSERFENSKSFFDALFTLQEGIKKFPRSEGIANNLALLYVKSNVIDSAFYYFNKSDKSSRERNLSALLARATFFNPDSLPPTEDKDLSEIANRISIYNNARMRFEESETENILSDSIIKFEEYAYLYNILLNAVIMDDVSKINKIDDLIELNMSEEYLRDLYLIRGIHRINNNNLSGAISDFDNSENFSGFTAGYIADLSATLLWSAGLPEYAVEKLQKASRMNYGNSDIKLFALYVELGKVDEAREQYKRVGNNKSFTQRPYIEWESLLEGNFESSSMDSFDENMKYTAFKLYPESWTEEDKLKFPLEFQDEGFRDKLSADILEMEIQNLNYDFANAFFNFWRDSLHSSSQLTQTYLDYLYKRNEKEDFISLFEEEYTEISGNPLIDTWYFELKGETEKAEEAAKLAIQNMGTNPDVNLLRITSLERNKTDLNDIYNEVVGLIQVFPNHPGIVKKYIEYAYRMGLPQFAEPEINHLEGLVQELEFQDFMASIEIVKQEYEEAENW